MPTAVLKQITFYKSNLFFQAAEFAFYGNETKSTVAFTQRSSCAKQQVGEGQNSVTQRKH